eukprot:TRINITY_DN17314_c0_g1_i2.p1 TRINITY_DN17314_c0_g1~~TRINITY_DN17314_c0_g1_i2.p1  ORF type:complete len:147 (-),score=31.73 TRINITY_DN17314_c0_g1_i2:52-492(-)
MIYESWRNQLKSAAKSVLIGIKNTTDYELSLEHVFVYQGSLVCNPQRFVPPHTESHFGAISNLISCKGSIIYVIRSRELNLGPLSLTWDIPFFGSPEFDSHCLSIEKNKIGDHSHITLHFSSDELYTLAHDTPPHNQTHPDTHGVD